MKIQKSIIKLVLGLGSIPVILFVIAYLIIDILRVQNPTILDWIPFLMCFVAYLIAGLITKKVPVKFIPILLAPLYFFILMKWGDLIITLLLFAIGTLLITRNNLKKIFKIPIILLMLLWFSFCLFSEPLIIGKYEWVEVQGQKVKAQTGKTVIWNFEDNKPRKLPKINLLDAERTKVSLEQFKGKKIFITFWATWCGPCVADKPQLEKIKSELNEHPDIIFIDISLDEDFKRWESYLDNKKPQGVQLVIDENARKIYKAFGCTGIPFGVIVESDGNFEASNFFRPGGINIIKTMNNLK